MKFTIPRYAILFLYSEIYIVHVINCEWSRSVNFPLHMFCMQHKHVFFQQRPTANVSFLGSAKDGDNFLNSIYIPSAPPLLSPMDQLGLIIVFTRMYWRLSLLTGYRIVLLQFACSALFLSLHLLVADIIVSFVEEFSAKYVPRGVFVTC